MFRVRAKRAREFTSRASFEQDFCHSIFEPSKFKQNFSSGQKLRAKLERAWAHFRAQFLVKRASKKIFFEQTSNYWPKFSPFYKSSHNLSAYKSKYKRNCIYNVSYQLCNVQKWKLTLFVLRNSEWIKVWKLEPKSKEYSHYL